jgi:hypothetical protein
VADLAIVMLVLGAVLCYSCGRTLFTPLPQYEAPAGPAHYQRLAFAGLLGGILLLLAGLVLALAPQYPPLHELLNRLLAVVGR